LGRTASHVEIRDSDEVAATPVRVVTQSLKICYSPYRTAGTGHFFHPHSTLYSPALNVFLPAFSAFLPALSIYFMD